jgi:hypothetical protein
MPEDDASIGNDEILLRRVAENSIHWDKELHRLRPSTSTFKQDGPDGLVSVYLSSETTPASVASGGPEKYLASIEAGFLRAQRLGIIRDPTSWGPGHCVITGRKTRGKLYPIACEAQWVEGYAPSS